MGVIIRDPQYLWRIFHFGGYFGVSGESRRALCFRIDMILDLIVLIFGNDKKRECVWCFKHVMIGFSITAFLVHYEVCINNNKGPNNN